MHSYTRTSAYPAQSPHGVCPQSPHHPCVGSCLRHPHPKTASGHLFDPHLSFPHLSLHVGPATSLPRRCSWAGAAGGCVALRLMGWEEISLTCIYSSLCILCIYSPSCALPAKTSSITYLHLCLSAFRSVSRSIGDLQRISCCTEVKKNLCILVLCSFFFFSCTSRASFVVDPEQQVINTFRHGRVMCRR